MKPKLYVALEGPILLPGTPDSGFKPAVASYAKSFLHWAKDRFNVVILTDSALREGLRVISEMGLALPVRGYVDSKTEALDPQEHYFWVDAELIPSEVAFLAQHGHHPRFLQVDSTKGVTPEIKTKLEGYIRK